MKSSAPERPIIITLSKVNGVPFDPDDPHNKDNVDFQLGYCRGVLGESGDVCAGVNNEWKRRGCPEIADDSFKDWKRGYWAGRFTAASRKEPHP